MNIEFITKADLDAAIERVISEIRKCLPPSSPIMEGYRTKEARRVLNCSAGKLMSLRIAGKLRYKKIGGTVYYNRSDIQKLLNEGFNKVEHL